ncbi:MAG: hypothetical protein KA760_10090, partial [Steroidobacteraceae bacterium]|nr:hypothetical protein [Steroidobacteraceae bacterium]
MVDARQAAYLLALGVDVYVPRSSPPWQDEMAAETTAPAVPAAPGPSPFVVARTDEKALHPDIAANLG